ncbi:phosphodiester glycosidase family protein, partial [Candidatus Sumerlaeota bacterium]|nr:phosphodiester glycosidase family protein [Candidatus Sumerlaeota bacterium]
MPKSSHRRSREIDLQPLAQAAKAPVTIEALALPPARRAKATEQLRATLNRLSALVGLRAVELRTPKIRFAAVRGLLEEIALIASARLAAVKSLPHQSLEVKGRRWRWTRHRQVLRPIHINTLTLTEESVPAAWVSGNLIIPLNAIPMDRASLSQLLTPRHTHGSLCVNTIAWKPSRTDRLAPQPLEVLSAEGRTLLSGDETLMHQMTAAFWEAHWATGTSRQSRGKTFPLALLPVRRDPEGPLDDAVLETSAGRIYGHQSIASSVLQTFASAGKLIHDPASSRFHFSSDRGVETREREALARLNDVGIFDRFVATPPPTRTFQIARVVPLRGAASVSDLMCRWGDHRAAARIGELPSPLAGINSLFFLNFPEEFANPHSALNDPVGALVIDGQWHSAPHLRRAALLLTVKGGAKIRTLDWADVVIETPLLPKTVVPWGGARAAGIPAAIDTAQCPRGGVRIFTPWSVAETEDGVLRIPSFRPGRDRAFVIVGTEIVEETLTREVAIPHSGWVLVIGRGVPGLDDIPSVLTGEMRRIRLAWRRPTDRRDIRHAMACGPQLLSAGRPLAANHFERCAKRGEPEQFLPWIGRGTATQRRGVAPTRLPCDVDHTRAPRTAVGITSRGEVILTVVDGRTDPRHSVGLTLREMALLMRGLGCREALNLDGGGSSICFLDHPEAKANPLLPSVAPGVVNRPSDRGGQERVVPLPLL